MALTIQYCSDLHLEFPDNRKFLQANPLVPAAPILVLAGDIMLFSDMQKNEDFLSYVADNFETTYWVPGNHEYYHFDAAGKCGILDEAIKSNVFLVNNTSKVHGDAELIFSTMWTKIPPAFEWQIEGSMNDFRIIKYDGKRLSAEKYNELHEESLAFIKNAVAETAGSKTAVITHHIPTFMHYPEQYKGDPLNYAFATELSEFIEPSNIVCWIYGHHHSNVPDYKIRNTLMLTNQVGYVQYGEHKTFKNPQMITI